jgi:hypothetical protein
MNEAVGWVERSEPHQNRQKQMVGLATMLRMAPLDPPYVGFRDEDGCEGIGEEDSQ